MNLTIHGNHIRCFSDCVTGGYRQLKAVSTCFLSGWSMPLLQLTCEKLR